MVVALKPLHDAFKIKRVVVSTYQSVTGTGIKAVNQMMNERNGVKGIFTRITMEHMMELCPQELKKLFV